MPSEQISARDEAARERTAGSDHQVESVAAVVPLALGRTFARASLGRGLRAFPACRHLAGRRRRLRTLRRRQRRGGRHGIGRDRSLAERDLHGEIWLIFNHLLYRNSGWSKTPIASNTPRKRGITAWRARRRPEALFLQAIRGRRPPRSRRSSGRP